jgi:predicted nucleotidyltransferase
MSISTKFQNLCEEIRIKSDIVENISSRYKRMTKQLNIDFWNTDSDTSHSLYVGSYGRDTEIHTSDIDILFKLPVGVYHRINSHIGNKQSDLLAEIRDSLRKTYSSSHISGDGQVVKIDFNDDINFEILPGFINEDQISFTYPDTNDGGSWKVTNPKAEIDEIMKTNIIWNYNLKRLCRMARAWKDKWGVPIGGLLIDTLAYNFLENWEHKDKSYVYYDYMTRDFFKFLKDQNEKQQYWLAPGSNQYIYRKGIFEYKALRCYNISLEAIIHEVDNEEYSANLKWKEIYGSKFIG